MSAQPAGAECYYEEVHGPQERQRSYFRPKTKSKSGVHEEGHAHWVEQARDGRGRFFSWRAWRQAFLPEHYPESVSDDYLAYQIWDTLQAFFSSVASSLSTQAVLKGVGVGDEAATAMSATLTWLLREGAGMAGQIVFTWAQGSDLDHRCKKWRLFADVLNDASMLVELSGPFWHPDQRQLVLCGAGLLRSLVGVAGGATRAAITQHQARRNNISDVAAKDGSQERLVNLSALGVNLILLPLLAEDATLTWSLFFLLTILHLWANFRAVRALRFDTLNKERLHIVVEAYLRTGRVPGVREANAAESVVLGFGADDAQRLFGRQIRFGCSLADADADAGPAEDALAELKARRFFISARQDDVNVVLQRDLDRADWIRVYFMACCVAMSRPEIATEQGVEEFLCELHRKGWKSDYLLMSSLGWAGGERKEKVS